MALTVKINGSTLPHGRVRLRDADNDGISGLTAAADGSGSQGALIIDDPDHSLTLRGWSEITVEESDCALPRLFTGYLADRTTTRGKYPSDGGRQFDVTINDQNVLLSLRLITGSDGKRPAETRTERITWLLASDYLDGLVFDTGFVVPSGGTQDFEAADYRGQYPADVLNDVLGAFQVFFARWDEAAGKVGLFYDTMTATTYDCTLSISNDPDDVDFSTCFFPYIDGQLSQDPSGVFSVERLTYTNGILLRDRPATASEFFPSPLLSRGEATDRSRIGKAQTASDYIDALLEQASEEQEIVTCTVLVPSTHVGLIDAGMRIRVKFVHLDGYEDFVWTRIVSRTTHQYSGRRDLYEITLTLNQRGPFTGGGGGGGSNPPPTVFPPGQTGHFYTETFPVIGDEIWGPFTPYGSVTGLQTCALGTITLVPDAVYTWDVVSSVLDPRANPTFEVTLINDDLTSTLSKPIDLVTPSSWNSGLGPYHYSGTFTAPDAGHIKNPYRMRGASAQGPHGHDVMATMTFFVDPPGWDATGQPPSPGQPNVRPETVTMSGANGTTLWPFADGTLRVIYDTIDQTPAIVTFDGAAGTFTMPSAPPLGTQVFVEYLGR